MICSVCTLPYPTPIAKKARYRYQRVRSTKAPCTCTKCLQPTQGCKHRMPFLQCTCGPGVTICIQKTAKLWPLFCFVVEIRVLVYAILQNRIQCFLRGIVRSARLLEYVHLVLWLQESQVWRPFKRSEWRTGSWTAVRIHTFSWRSRLPACKPASWHQGATPIKKPFLFQRNTNAVPDDMCT